MDIDFRRGDVIFTATMSLAEVVRGIGEDNVLDAISVSTCVDYCGADVILDHIGKEYCKKHFDLVEDKI